MINKKTEDTDLSISHEGYQIIQDELDEIQAMTIKGTTSSNNYYLNINQVVFRIRQIMNSEIKVVVSDSDID